MSVGVEDVLPSDFGKYRLIRKIATGGMAEIFLAHENGKPKEPIVIKRILPHLIKSAEFVSMFLDEARIAAQLEHPNIVRIHDIGQINGAYFIAMEYVHGEDIRRIYNCAYKLQRSLPLSHSIRVIADAACGLAYAHKLVDFANRPMGVVHRDVSPQNILVTYEGGVKVVDFGIAKAANKVNQTRAGVLKGKYSYMSPEQALGDNIDHRTDIFALGIILYETTTGTRLFKRHNELATLQAIIKCEYVLPTDALSGYPPDLERVLLKALAKDPDDRYADAQDFSDALYDFLHTSELYVEREIIAEFMRDLFKDRLDEEEKLGAPVLAGEDEVREEMREGGTAEMKSSSRLSVSPSHPYEPGEQTGNADTHLGRLRNESHAYEVPTEDDEQEGTTPELDEEELIRHFGGIPGDTRQEPPSTIIQPKGRSQPRVPTEMIRPREGREPMRSTPPKSIAPRSLPPRAPSPSSPFATAASSVGGSITSGQPPADMLPTVAAQPVYQGEPSNKHRVNRDEEPRRNGAGPRTILPERSDEARGKAEPTEQVRLRPPGVSSVPPPVASAPKVRAARERDPRKEIRHVPTGTQVHKAVVPKLAIAAAAILAAILAGIVASRIAGSFTNKSNSNSPQPMEELAANSDRFGRMTVVTEPGASVWSEDQVLGIATAEGVAGPFRVAAGTRKIRVTLESAGFERERVIEIQADRIHEFEIRGRKGWLSFRVQPWARVVVDGHDMGVTPLPNLQIYEGTHTVIMENADIKKRHEQKVRVDAGQTFELKVNLNELGQPF